MILIVNPNPALDRVAVVRYRPRATLRPERFFTWPGGSGVHAGHVATMLGASVRVIGFAGGPTGAILGARVSSAGMANEWFAVAGDTRQTMSLLDVETGNLCDVVEPGPSVEPQEVAELEAAVIRRLAAASVVVISGSLPDGCPLDLPARIVAKAREAGVPVIADLEGAVLEATMAKAPWMIKPSLEEMALRLGHAPSADELLAECARWRDRGVEHVCVSMADRGLLWLSQHGLRHISGLAVPAFNSIGCGDALVGATAATYERLGDVSTALRTGVAAAIANLSHDQPGHCEPGEVAELLPHVRDEAIGRGDLGRLIHSSSPAPRVTAEMRPA